MRLAHAPCGPHQPLRLRARAWRMHPPAGTLEPAPQEDLRDVDVARARADCIMGAQQLDKAPGPLPGRVKRGKEAAAHGKGTEPPKDGERPFEHLKAGKVVAKPDGRALDAIALKVEANGAAAIRKQQALRVAIAHEPCAGSKPGKIERVLIRPACRCGRPDDPGMGRRGPHRPRLRCGEAGILERVQVPKERPPVPQALAGRAILERPPGCLGIFGLPSKPLPGEAGAFDVDKVSVGRRIGPVRDARDTRRAMPGAFPEPQPAKPPMGMALSAMQPTTAEPRRSIHSLKGDWRSSKGRASRCRAGQASACRAKL